MPLENIIDINLINTNLTCKSMETISNIIIIKPNYVPIQTTTIINNLPVYGKLYP